MNWLKSLITKLSQQGSINYLLKSNPSLFKEYQDKKKDIVIPSQYTGEAGEIIRKWIFYRNKQGENVNLNGLDVILVNPLDKSKSWFTKPSFTFQDLIKKNEEYHERLKETKDRVYIPKYPISILKQYNNGLAWGRLETGYCESYGKSLGHCGNVGGAEDNTQRIYTFYDTITNIHYLTFIYHKNGILGEAKAYSNSKPPVDKIRILNREDLQSVDAQQIYKDLLLLKDKDQYIWNVIRGAGYKPENNFQFEDLNEKDKEEVKKERENIDDYFEYKKGKDSDELYFIEDGEAYFNKNITKEQLEKIRKNDVQLFYYGSFYKYIKKLDLQNDPIVIERVKTSSRFCSLYIININPYMIDIDKEIIINLIKGYDYTINVLENINFNLNKVPNNIIDMIFHDSSISYAFASRVRFNLEKIPKRIILSIANARDSMYAYYFAKGLKFDLNKIPQEIIESISKDAEDSMRYARSLDFNLNKIPPKIIKAISSSAEYSYQFAKGVNFDFSKIPQEIMNGIYDHALTCFELIKHFDFNLNSVSNEAIIGISKSSLYSFKLAVELKFDLNKIPKEIIEAISRRSDLSYQLAYNFDFDPSKIPLIIVKSILKDENYRKNFLNNLKKSNIEIPEWINNYESDNN